MVACACQSRKLTVHGCTQDHFEGFRYYSAFGKFEFPASIPIWAVHAQSSLMAYFRSALKLASEQVPTVPRPGQPALGTYCLNRSGPSCHVPTTGSCCAAQNPRSTDPVMLLVSPVISWFCHFVCFSFLATARPCQLTSPYLVTCGRLELSRPPSAAR